MKRRPQFSKTQRASIHSIGMDVACIMSSFDWKAWQGEDSRSVFQAATEAAVAVEDHIYSTGKDVFSDEDIDFTEFSERIAAKIEGGSHINWSTEIPKMIAAWILESIDPMCSRCGKAIRPCKSWGMVKGEYVHSNPACDGTSRNIIDVALDADLAADAARVLYLHNDQPFTCPTCGSRTVLSSEFDGGTIELCLTCDKAFEVWNDNDAQEENDDAE
jgi:hypothetical protein